MICSAPNVDFVQFSFFGVGKCYDCNLLFLCSFLSSFFSQYVNSLIVNGNVAYHLMHNARIFQYVSGLVVDGNITYHLTYNVRKSQNKSRKRCEHQDWNPGGQRPTRPSYHWTTSSFAFLR
jgi:hypothetical protein